jgi:hypothetical protein
MYFHQSMAIISETRIINKTTHLPWFFAGGIGVSMESFIWFKADCTMQIEFTLA